MPLPKFPLGQIQFDNKIINKPQTGKYKFNTIANFTVTTSFNNAGLPLKSKIYRFKSGDVIDVQKMSFKEGIGWETQISAITEYIKTVPFSVLTKVDDRTPVTKVDTEEKAFSGSGEGLLSGGNTQIGNNNSTNTAKSDKNIFFTTKNILIGIVIIGGLFGILKWKKVI